MSVVRWLGVTLASALALSVPPVAAGGAAPAPALRASADADLSLDEASARARATGAPVEVTAETTETNRIVARPDGAFELDAHVEAVRTEIHGDWEPIDTSLIVRADGTIEPKAITLPVTFAAGASTGPIVTAGTGSDTLSFGWDEGPLPEPVVEGDQVTYPEVRPGVDLVFTAHATGFSDAIVVKSASAAAALGHDPIEFTGTSPGLDLSMTADGTLVAASSDGETALASPPPVGWDSSGGGSGVNEPAADNVGSGALHDLPLADITESEASPQSSVTLEVSPPSAVVEDSDTVYPLYLDPQFSGRLNTRFRTMHSGGWNYGTPSTDLMRVGYCDWAGCNDSFQRNARSFFEFDASALTGGENSDPVILDASVQAQQVWNADSAAQPVQLRKTTRAFTNSDDYPGPSGTNLQQISSAAGHNNNPAWLRFDSSAIASYISAEAAAEHSNISFALSAPSEGNKYYWKKFNNDAKLSLVFGYAPRITGYASTDTVACPGEYVQSRGSLSVKITADSVWGYPEMDFAAQIFKNDTANDGPWDLSTLVRSTGWVANGSNYTWTTKFDNLTQGLYAWRANAMTHIGIDQADGTEYPGIQKVTDPATRPFYVDTVDPAVPYVVSDDYPRDYWGRSVSNPGTIAVVIPADAAGIAYRFNQPAPAVTNADCDYTRAGFKPRSAAVGNVIHVPVVNTSPGDDLTAGVPQSLTVYTFDKAHNQSAPVTYPFYISPNHPGSTVTNRVEVESTAIIKNRQGVTVTGEVTPASTPATGKYLTMTATDKDAYVDIQVPFTQPGYYALGTKLAACATCHEARFSMLGAQVGAEAGVNTSDPATAGLGYVQIGGYPVEVEPGQSVTRTVRVRFPQASAEEPTTVKMDFLTVAQIQGGTYGTTGTLHGNLAEAFNNRGIASEGGPGGVFEHDKAAGQPPRSLSLQKLQSVEIVQGQPYTATFTPPGAVGPVSATFDVPAATSKGDNVIAAGQTIRVPANSGTDHVDFLVAATCGAVPRALRTQFGLTHQPATGSTVTTDHLLPFEELPGWRAAPVGSLSPITMSGSVQGSTSTAVAGDVSLYVMEVDVNTDRVGDSLVGVTLPSTGTTLTQGCTGKPQLHVLAMTTRKDS